VEVRYDHVTGGRFRHGTKLIRFRPDKAPHQCTKEQLRPEAAPQRIVAMTRNQQPLAPAEADAQRPAPGA
jgi:ATP-dependent DNA ligase